MRVGIGFDVHPLVSGRPLVLGGVEIAHERGLAGHSDADVLAHAIGDALLGAIGAGDLGTHFPPGDPKWKGASGRRLLEAVRARVREAGFRIENVDTTVIAEAPRLAPVRERMEKELAGMLGLDEDRVNVKLKSTDGLGSIGRGEGIAAQAIALVVRCDP